MVFRLVKIGWVVATVIVIFVTIYLFDDRPNSDVDVFLIWSMLVLSFPSSIVCALIYSGVAYVLYQSAAITVPTTYLSIILLWTIFFLMGYWQWFVLGPRLVKMLRKK